MVGLSIFCRSGSNELHGSAVGHIRETDWLANNFFANRAGQPIADQPYRDWAFSLGGPIVIPKIYNGRNKTFFFAGDESYRQQLGATTVLPRWIVMPSCLIAEDSACCFSRAERCMSRPRTTRQGRNA